MKYGDKGGDVMEMQEWLEAEGYKLPKYGCDGDFGGETQIALNAFEKDRGLPVTPKGSHVPQATLDAMAWEAPEDEPVPDPPEKTVHGLKLYDFRDEPFSKRNPKKFKLQPGTPRMPVVREPSQVTGITIHQTAAPYGVADYQVQAAGGDRELALARRALGVACHTMAFRGGFGVVANDLRHYVYHGNGWNSTELGLEIDGRYPGVKGGKTWDGKKASVVTDDVVKAACLCIEWMVIEGRKAGMPIEYIHAHRQSSATRRDDPGEELWERVVLGFAVPTLGLKTEPGRTLKDGRPVPVEWDPNGVGGY